MVLDYNNNVPNNKEFSMAQSKQSNPWPARGFYHYTNAETGKTNLIRVVRWIRIQDEYEEDKDEYAYIAECDTDQNTGMEDFNGDDLSSNHLCANQSSFHMCDNGSDLWGLGTMTECDFLKFYLSTEGLDIEHKDNVEMNHS